MPELWTPGAGGPSLEAFVNRVHRKIEDFMVQRGWDEAFVEVQLHDGSRFVFHSISAEPGFGLITLCPYPEDEEKAWPSQGAESGFPPEELIVPVGSIMRITLREPEEERRLGFSVPSP